MEREQYKFRSKARVVAFVDLILSSMSLCLCLMFFVGLLRITTMSQSDAVMIFPKGDGESTRVKIEQDGPGMSQNEDPDGPKLAPGLRPAPTIDTRSAFVKLMWIFLALVSIMTAVQILAAVRLLNATQLGKDPVGAMKLCRFWRRVCLFFTGLLIFNFLSSFRAQGENFFEVSFLMTNILVRIVAMYIVQQFVNELDVAIVSTLPIRRQYHPTAAHLVPNLGGDNLAYAYGFQVPKPSQVNQAPPPSYEDVVKVPYKEPTTSANNEA